MNLLDRVSSCVAVLITCERLKADNTGKPQEDDTGFIDSGCSRHMTRNIAYLSDFKEFDEGYVTFGGGAHGGRISAEILKKFNYTDVKSASTPVDLEKPLVKDGDDDDVDIPSYSKDITSLSCKEIFRYLKGKPTLGLWYSRDSLFELVSYTDSDYARATQDRKSTTGGCQFLGNRLISWQCKKKTVVATSTTEAEYVATASCCGQVLWIQNQLLDYGKWEWSRAKSAPITLSQPKSLNPELHINGEMVYRVEFFEGWKPLLPLQLAVEEVMSE
ncbi:hypothetical protein Tco_0025695 [Tanacetum coccineum]